MNEHLVEVLLTGGLFVLFAAIGTLLRYALSTGAQRYFQSSFPYATLTVNLLGSAVVGAICAQYSAVTTGDSMKALLALGLLGSFTTCSTFNVEMLQCLRAHQWRTALIYGLCSYGGGISLAALTYSLFQ